MRNVNWTRVLTILLALLALYALLAVAAGIIQRFITPLLLVILAAILAFILTPVVDFIQARFHLFRPLSILTTYLLVAVILGSLGYFLTSPLIAQTKSLADAIKTPTHLKNVTRVRDTSAALFRDTRSYYSHIASGDPCGAAKLIDEYQAVTRYQSCTAVPKPNHTIPQLLYALRTTYVPELNETTVRPTSKKTAKSRGKHSAPVPATQVPPRWRNPIDRDLIPLVSEVRTAKTDLANDRGGRIVADARSLLKKATRLNHDVRHMYSIVKSTPIFILALQTRFDRAHLSIDLHSLSGKAVSKVSSQGSIVLDNAVTILTSTINVIFDLFVIIILSVYLLADGGRFISWALGLVPEAHREQAWFFIASLDTVLGGYIRGQLIVATTIGVLAGTGSYVLGVPYALLIGIFAFLAESIPVIGPVLASIPAILVSLFTQPFPKTLLVIGWFIIIQQIEQNIVGPRITGHAVGIHPVVAMVAIIIGLEVGGFWGAFLAVPVTGLLAVIAREGYSVLVLRRPMPTATVPESMEVIEPDEDSRGAHPAAE